MATVVAQLGRLGDIINVLPLLEESNRMGKRVTLCCARDFSSLLDGISYADRLIWHGDYSDLDGATAQLVSHGHRVLVSQIYGKNLQHCRRTESFLRDSYAKLGREHRYEQLSLTFDRRNPDREARLVAQVDWTKPVVLMSLGGHSAPYRKGPELLAKLTELLPEFSVLDLSIIKAERFYDLLGVFDRAQALVTIDTGTLHLAKASSVPVVALVASEPWISSTRFANHLLRRTYLEVDPEEIAENLRKTTRGTRKIVHVWPDWDMGEADRVRNVNSRASWLAEYAKGGWTECQVDYRKEFSRNSASELGDLKPTPFIKDLLAAGLAKTRHDTDIVVLTNSDVGFSPDITRRLTALIGAKGSCFSYRYDLSPEQARKAPSYYTTVSGNWCGGLDFFAFSRKWLRLYLEKCPDMVAGRTHWDLVFRDIVKRTGGGELYGAIWHETHSSFWIEQPKTAGNTHNLLLAQEYYAKHDTTRPYRDTWA